MRRSQRSNQSFSQQNQYGWQTPPDTQDISALRDFRPTLDPTIGFRAGDAKRQLRSSFINPMGGYTTPQIRDAVLRAGERDIDQRAGEQFRAGAYDQNQMRLGQLGSLAGLTSPRLTQTSSTGTGQSTTSMPSNIFGDILGAGAQIGSAAIM